MAKPRARAPGPQRDRPPLPEDVTYHHCHATAEDLTRRIAAFEAQVNQDACAVADRLWVKDGVAARFAQNSTLSGKLSLLRGMHKPPVTKGCGAAR